MAVEQFDCPWCETRNCAFSSIAEHDGRSFNKLSIRFVLFQCNRCASGVMAKYRCKTLGANPPLHSKDGNSFENDWKREHHFPAQQMDEGCPNHTPEPVDTYFNEGADNVRHENWNSAGGMFRKTVDVTTKHLIRENWKDQEEEGRKALQKLLKKDLIDRIGSLHHEGYLTDALKDWAHQVRIGGNDALHEEEPYTEKEARALSGFTRLFLTYVFTMPTEVEERRAEFENVEAEEQPKGSGAGV